MIVCDKFYKNVTKNIIIYTSNFKEAIFYR